MNDDEYTKLAMALGLITEEELIDARKSQDVYHHDTGVRPPMSEVLRRTGRMSPDDDNYLSTILGIPGYRAISRLAKGAQGSVFLGWERASGRQVALKVMTDVRKQGTAAVGRFLREAKFLTEFRHPNIIAALAVGQNRDMLYLATEFVEGETVHAIMERDGYVPPPGAARIGAQTADALEYMRKRGVVHRDIKPDNLIVTREGVTKICDLGLVRMMNSFSPITETGMVIGSLCYISPEQIEEKPVDSRSDIYALGATLYTMVTGGPPFFGESYSDLLEKHMKQPPEDPREYNPDLPEPFALAILKCLEKKRENRFETPGELAAVLRGFATTGG